MDEMNKDNFNDENENIDASNEEIKEDSFENTAETDNTVNTDSQTDYTSQNPYSEGYYNQSGQSTYSPQEPKSYYSGNYSYTNYQNSNYQNSNPNNNYGSYYTGTPDNFNKPKKKKKGLKVVLAIVALIVVMGIGIGIGSAVQYMVDPDSFEENSSGDSTIIKSEETPESSKVTGDKLSIEEIAEIGRASNVGVLVYANSNSFSSSNSAKAGEGTGIVAKVSDDKKYTYIITCAHVISDSGISVKVLLEDGTTYDADIVGFDLQTDIGVLKVKATNLQCAEFGDFEKLQVGSPVYAVGNPGGSEFFGSFTNGIVSAISRSINNEIGYTMDCIQHNAAINPGNSGGALLNEYGQVIGVNSSKIASTDYEGMSFSVPISTALDVANDIIAKGYVPDRPKLGITYSLASSHSTYSMIVQIKGLPAGSLIVREISSDSALKDTDVQVGDMITSVNGKKLDTADVLLDMIDKSKVGDKLTLGICRVNTDYSLKEFEVEVALVEDKGSTSTQEETTYVNPFDYFNQYGGGNYGN